MKALNNIKILASLLVAGTALSACLNDKLPEVQPTETFTMRVEAERSLGTRALADEASTLTGTWDLDDEVNVYKGTEKIGTLRPNQASSTATLSGTVSGVAKGDELSLTFGTPNNYATQDGTLEYIDANCNYAEATVQVTDIVENVVSTTAATFANAQSITKFTFSKSLKSVTIGGGTSDITVTLASPGTVAYVAMPGTTDTKAYTFEAHDAAGILMRGTKSAALANGKFYTASVRLVAGGVELYYANPWSTSGALSYDIPKGVKIKSATLVVNVYSGSGAPTYGVSSTVTVTTTNGDSVYNETLKYDGVNTANDPTAHTINDHTTKCYSDYQMIYDLTSTLQDLENTNVGIEVTTAKLGSYYFDGRIKLIALVVVYDGGENDSFTYWLDTTQRWTTVENSLTFDTSSYGGTLRKARLLNIALSSAAGSYKLNGVGMPTPEKNEAGDYFVFTEWNILNMITKGANTVLSSYPSTAMSTHGDRSLKDVLTLLIYESE